MIISALLNNAANIVSVLVGTLTIGAATWGLLLRLRFWKKTPRGGVTSEQIRNFFIGAVVLALLVTVTSLVSWPPRITNPIDSNTGFIQTPIPTPTNTPIATPTDTLTTSSDQSINENPNISLQCSSCAYSNVTTTLTHVGHSAGNNTTLLTIVLYDGASTNFTHLSYNATLSDSYYSYRLYQINGSYSCTCYGKVTITAEFFLTAKTGTQYTLGFDVYGTAEVSGDADLADSYQTTFTL
jgi:hypothetical protein